MNTKNVNSGVYIIQMGKYFKIGVSKDIENRLRNIDATLLPEEPKIRYTLESSKPYDDERILHEKYSVYRVRGEWFDFNSRVLEEIVETNRFVEISKPEVCICDDKSLDDRIRNFFKKESRMLNIKKNEYISAKRQFEKRIIPYENYIIHRFKELVKNSR